MRFRAERKAGKTSEERADAGSEQEDDQVKWYGQARPALISIEAFSGALSSTTSVSSYSLQAGDLG